MQRCLGRGVELFRVKLPRVEVGGISSSVGGAGPASRAVRVFCGWDLAVGGSGGGAWELTWLVGPTHTMGIKGGNGHPRVIANCHSPREQLVWLHQCSDQRVKSCGWALGCFFI